MKFEGVIKGRREGEIKGRLKIIIEWLNEVFELQSAQLQKKVKRITNIEVLDKIIRLLRTSQIYEEIESGVERLLVEYPDAMKPLKFDSDK